MARKRLDPARAGDWARPGGGLSGDTGRAPPIARVAGEAADAAGLDAVARTLAEAREEGRLVQRLPLDQIRTGTFLRDRIYLDEDEMAGLRESLRVRGQQVPVDVVPREGGDGYDLISGLRRVTALRDLGAAEVLAVVRKPAQAGATYLAMVEENELRAGLSYYERARLVLETARRGVFPDAQAAVKALFARASPAKRSKILSFGAIHDHLGDVLRHPAVIPERLGLKLAQALDGDDTLAARIAADLSADPPADAAAERGRLEAHLKGPGTPSTPAPDTAPDTVRLSPDLVLEARAGRLVLTGQGADAALRRDLEAWLRARA